MGSSYTEYKGQGFWARDTPLEIWIRLLAINLPGALIPGWQKDLQHEWFFWSSGKCNGFISAQLDTLCDDAEKVSIVLKLVNETLSALKSNEDYIQPSFLNLLGLSSHFEGEYPTRLIIDVGVQFKALLEENTESEQPGHGDAEESV